MHAVTARTQPANTSTTARRHPTRPWCEVAAAAAVPCTLLVILSYVALATCSDTGVLEALAEHRYELPSVRVGVQDQLQNAGYGGVSDNAAW
jgi:hypothetical protein